MLKNTTWRDTQRIKHAEYRRRFYVPQDCIFQDYFPWQPSLYRCGCARLDKPLSLESFLLSPLASVIDIEPRISLDLPQ